VDLDLFDDSPGMEHLGVVGHYGVFSGRRWQQQVDPRVREMIHDCH
jgi:poly-beta-hydroxyalkanoate depolymerase